jgi:hypothetical protein
MNGQINEDDKRMYTILTGRAMVHLKLVQLPARTLSALYLHFMYVPTRLWELNETFHSLDRTLDPRRSSLEDAQVVDFKRAFEGVDVVYFFAGLEAKARQRGLRRSIMRALLRCSTPSRV